MSPRLRILYFIPWIGAVTLLIWLCMIRIPPSGVRSFSIVFDGRSPWANPFLPGQRASTIGVQPEGWVGQRLTDEPAYSTLRLPGIYQRLETGLEFRAKKQPLIEVGFTDDPDGGIEFQPFWSEVLSSGWRQTSWQGKQGYVREGDPDSALGEQDMNRVLVWHASTTPSVVMDSTPRTRSFATALRGSFEIQAIPVQGKLKFVLEVQNMNRQKQKGGLVITLSKNGILLWSEALSLVGSRDNKPSPLYPKTISFDGLEGGIYKVSMVADDDIFTRSITSSLRHWVIGPRIYFGDRVGYATTPLPGIAWTNAQHLQIETLHPEGRQRVTLGSATVNVAEMHRSYQLDRAANERGSAQLLRAPRGDVRILGDGYFALAPDLLFLPSPRRLTDASLPLEEGIRAILTPYVSPQVMDDGWYRSTNAYRLRAKPGVVRLVISAPGIQERQGSVDVRAIQLTYSRDTLSWRAWTQAIWRELASAWRAL